MVKTSLWPLQQAIVQRLESDTALAGKVTGVFDSVGKGTKFPYISIGEPTASPFKTKTTYGEEIVVVLQCWSTYAGKKEAYEVLNLMLQALTKQAWTVEGFKVQRVQIEPNITVLNPVEEGFPSQGILRMRFFINN